MATQIVISNGEMITLDNNYNIKWVDKGNAMPSLPSTIHFVIWNNLVGQNEIQNKDASTGLMTGNTPLNATSDAVGSTTVSALLTWAETRKNQIETAKNALSTAIANGDPTPDHTWEMYDPNYS
jgi:hypothetical protein